MPIVTPSEGLDLIVKDAKKIIASEALGLKADLVSAAPVDTGNFKAGWQMKKVSDLHFLIYNPVKYASILWAGRRTVGGKAYGSEQWTNGGDPMLKQTDISISRRMQGIKR